MEKKNMCDVCEEEMEEQSMCCDPECLNLTICEQCVFTCEICDRPFCEYSKDSFLVEIKSKWHTESTLVCVWCLKKMCNKMKKKIPWFYF